MEMTMNDRLADAIRRANDDSDHVTPEQVKAAHDVLGVLSPSTPGAWSPGSFTTKLIDALCSADRENRALVAQVYPELVEAVVLYKEDPDGLDILSQRASI